MRAVIQNSVGGPDVLVIADQPDPTAKASEVLVRVKAAGINPVDGAILPAGSATSIWCRAQSAASTPNTF